MQEFNKFSNIPQFLQAYQGLLERVSGQQIIVVVLIWKDKSSNDKLYGLHCTVGITLFSVIETK